jgi:hypothetical protein
MAYLAFDFDPTTAAGSVSLDRDTQVAFNPREWQVIRLAQTDRVARQGSRLTRLVQLLFGLRVTNPLADPRLETLRMAATRLWHDAAPLDHGLIEQLRAQDFSFGQLTLLSGWIGARRR